MVWTHGKNEQAAYGLKDDDKACGRWIYDKHWHGWIDDNYDGDHGSQSDDGERCAIHVVWEG